MYKLMIVDNDRQARERITSGIDMDRLGIEVCARADNGIQATELFMRHRPDIVITEIALPLMSGMDAAKQILQLAADTKVIVVTQSGTLELAREAVRCGMEDFMPKPVDLRDLEALLHRIVTQLQMHRQSQLQLRRFRELLERSMPLIRSDYFLRLLRTPAQQIDSRDCAQHLQDFGIEKKYGQICVSILVSDDGDASDQAQPSARQTLAEELELMLQPLGIGTVILCDSMHRTVVISYADQSDLAQTLAQKLSLLRDKMRYVYRRDFYAAVGDTVNCFEDLSKSNASAERALCYWSVMNDNHIISSQRLQDVALPSVRIPAVRYEDVMTMLTGSDSEQLCASLEQYLRQAAYESGNSVHHVQLMAIELLATLICCAREVGCSVEQLHDGDLSVYIQIMQQSSIQKIIEIVQWASRCLSEAIWGRREDSKFRALSDAKRYIAQHYADPNLSLAKVAEQVNLSPSYVSQLFKRMDDSTFTEYLNHVRIEQAKRLLSTTHMRVYEVADAVGYQSSKYFFQLFKQITGKRPREFYQGPGAKRDGN